MSQHEWVETSRKPLPCPCCASLNKRQKQISGGKKIECFVLQTRFICRIPRGRLPPSVCLSLAVSTAAQQDWPSTRFNVPPPKCRHSRKRQQGRKLQQLRPCATSGTNQTKKRCHRQNTASGRESRSASARRTMSEPQLSNCRARRDSRRNLVDFFHLLVVL